MVWRPHKHSCLCFGREGSTGVSPSANNLMRSWGLVHLHVFVCVVERSKWSQKASQNLSENHEIVNFKWESSSSMTRNVYRSDVLRGVGSMW